MCKMAQLASFEEVHYLMECASRRYPEITLTSKNAKEFESRCYEINVCEKLLTSIMDDLFFSPEDILFLLFIKCRNRKKDILKRIRNVSIILQEIEVIKYLEQELKIYKGESS